MPNIFGWGNDEPQILPKEQGGDTIAVFTLKIKNLFQSLFNTLNSYPWSNATQTAAGYMSSDDKAKVDDAVLLSTAQNLTGPKTLNLQYGAWWVTNPNVSTRLGLYSANEQKGLLHTDGYTPQWLLQYYPKKFELSAIDPSNSGNTKNLVGKTDGTLTWEGEDVATIQTGTWTPTLYGATTTGAFSYTTRVGKYCKIGQLVYIYANLQCNCTTAPVGQACISGIPFSCEDESGAGGFSILTSGAGTSYSLKRLSGLNIRSNYIILRITNEGDNTVDNANFNPNDSSSYNLKIPSGQSIVLGFSAVYRTTQ